MRAIVITLAFAALCTPASASSIEPVATGILNNDSITLEKCTDCPAPKPATVKKDYVVSDIPLGTTKEEIRDVNGVLKIYRTEHFAGGSPVVFVTKAPASVVAAEAARVKPNLAQSALSAAMGAVSSLVDMTSTPSVDSSATTSSLANIVPDMTTQNAGMTGDALRAAAQPQTQPLDTSKFELRLN